MNISKRLTITLCLILSLAQTVTPQSAFVGNENTSPPGKPPLGATSPIAPIGKVESTGRITINGRAASANETIWDGELLQVPAGSNASVMLESIGHVTLKGGSAVRLATVSTRLKDQISRRTLSASVVNGEMNVKLNSEALAFVQAGRSAYLATAGANFHVSVRDDEATLRTLNGEVLEMGNWAITMPMMSIERESLANSIKPLSGSGGRESNLEAGPHVKAMAGMIGIAESSAKAKPSSRKYFILPIESGYQTSVQAMYTRELKFKVTNELSRPAPGLPVTFSLSTSDGKSVGALGYGRIAANRLTVITDAQGVATVLFKASNEPGSVAINATVEGASQPQTRLVTVTKDKEKFWTKKNAIPVFATAAAMIVAGIVVVATKGDRLPIKGTGPVEIIP